MSSTLFCLEKSEFLAKIKERNYAFIDSQNVNLGVQELGWRLDWRRFRVYLKEKYGVAKAYMFIGYLPKNKNLYQYLQRCGYILVFKPISIERGEVKGNIDADLVLRAMIDINDYDRAVIVTSDGDFYCLVNYFYKINKLKIIVSPNYKKCSILLRKVARENIDYMNNLEVKLKYIK